MPPTDFKLVLNFGLHESSLMYLSHLSVMLPFTTIPSPAPSQKAHPPCRVPRTCSFCSICFCSSRARRSHCRCEAFPFSARTCCSSCFARAAN